jgi:hypothetical protein
MSLTRRQLLAAGLAAAVGRKVQAAVSFLTLDALPLPLPLLVLVDEERLEKTLLTRLEGRGFRSELQPVPDCSSVDFGLLTSRIRQAGRIIGLLGPANHVLVLEALRYVGARVELDVPAELLQDAESVELFALRQAMGPAASGLQALLAQV